MAETPARQDLHSRWPSRDRAHAYMHVFSTEDSREKWIFGAEPWRDGEGKESGGCGRVRLKMRSELESFTPSKIGEIPGRKGGALPKSQKLSTNARSDLPRPGAACRWNSRALLSCSHAWTDTILAGWPFSRSAFAQLLQAYMAAAEVMA